MNRWFKGCIPNPPAFTRGSSKSALGYVDWPCRRLFFSGRCTLALFCSRISCKSSLHVPRSLKTRGVPGREIHGVSATRFVVLPLACFHGYQPIGEPFLPPTPCPKQSACVARNWFGASVPIASGSRLQPSAAHEDGKLPPWRMLPERNGWASMTKAVFVANFLGILRKPPPFVGKTF